MNADGTEERVHLDGPERDSAPSWAPEGTGLSRVRLEAAAFGAEWEPER